MLLIDFFELAPINFLLPIKTMQPDRVTFIIDVSKVDTVDARHVRESVENVEGVEEFKYVPVDANNVEAIKEQIKKLVDAAEPGEEVYIDITGGTDLMVASGYSAASETRAIPIHIDIVNDTVFRVDTLEKIADVNHISLKDYLTAIGAKQLKGSHKDPDDEEAERICEMAEILFKKTSEWNALCSKIATAFSKAEDQSSLKFTITDKIVYTNKKSFNPKGLMKDFCRRGFVTYLGDGENETGMPGEREFHYELTDEKYREYMTVYGEWLEMYVYLKLKPYFDEAYLGMVIDWDNDDEIDTVDNEIDVALMKNSVPYFISCKMRRIEASDIYEIGFITEHFGGEYGKSYIATTHDLSGRSRGAVNLKGKMEKMNVGMVYVRDKSALNKVVRSQRLKPVVVEEDMPS